MGGQKNTPMTVSSLVFKSPATRFLSVLSRSRISATMSRLCVVNPTDIFVLVRQFSQPGASFDIISGNGAYPNIVYELIAADGNWVDPFQYILPARFLP
jgi:hypothetical protein